MPCILYSGGLGNQLLQISAHSFLRESLSADVTPKTIWFGLNKGQRRDFLLPRLFDPNQLHRLGFSNKQLIFSCTQDYFYRPIRLFCLNIYYYLLNLLAVDTSASSNLSFLSLPKHALGFKGSWHTSDFISQLVFKVLPRILTQSSQFKSLVTSVKDLYDFNHTACIHMRFGDYLGSNRYVQLSQSSYYITAVDILHGLPEVTQFLVVTDDIDRAKLFISSSFTGISFHFISSLSSLTDFAILSSSKYLITANSTFSLTASSIPSCFNGTIIYPNTWFKNKPPIFNVNNPLIDAKARILLV